MSRLGRVLVGVTPRRVVAVLVVGGFATQIFSVASWAAGTGLGIASAATPRAIVLTTVRLALEVAAICLVARSLARAFGGGGRSRVDPRIPSQGESGPAEEAGSPCRATER